MEGVYYFIGVITGAVLAVAYWYLGSVTIFFK